MLSWWISQETTFLENIYREPKLGIFALFDCYVPNEVQYCREFCLPLIICFCFNYFLWRESKYIQTDLKSQNTHIHTQATQHSIKTYFHGFLPNIVYNYYLEIHTMYLLKPVPFSSLITLTSLCLPLIMKKLCQVKFVLLQIFEILT